MTRIDNHFSIKITKLLSCYYKINSDFLDLDKVLEDNKISYLTEGIVASTTRPIEKTLNFIHNNNLLIFTCSLQNIEFYIACKNWKLMEKKIINIINKIWHEEHHPDLLNIRKMRGDFLLLKDLAEKLGYKITKI